MTVLLVACSQPENLSQSNASEQSSAAETDKIGDTTETAQAAEVSFTGCKRLLTPDDVEKISKKLSHKAIGMWYNNLSKHLPN